MARIRSIKPETPQSESMGRVSRDARLLFIMLWTLADDSGRLRGSSRMLASLLFPYDNDAPDLIDDWLGELVQEVCIKQYQASGHEYIQLCNWLKHQKIDKPSQSKIPAFDDASSVPRESSRILPVGSRIKGSEDQGSKDHGSRIEGSGDQGTKVKPLPAAKPPGETTNPLNIETWKAYAQAYRKRYKTDPVRNASVNGKLAQLVKRLGAEAPDVAAYYVHSNTANYTRDKHGVGLLLRDAEGLRTEWATGMRITHTQAMQADRTQSNADAFAPLIAEAEAAQRREREEAEHHVHP